MSSRAVLCVAIAGAILGVPSAEAQSNRKCKPSRPPEVVYQLDVPKEPGSTELVRVQLASEYCPSEYRDMSWSRWRVIDADGRKLHQAESRIIPLSAKHGIVRVGFNKIAMVRFGKDPGPELPFGFPDYDQTFFPGLNITGNVSRDITVPVVVRPMAISVAGSTAQGSPTTFTAALFTGQSYEPKILEGLGGKAIFGTDRFEQYFAGDFSSNLRAADYVMPRRGNLLFQNMTAPDGSAVSIALDGNGDPVGPAIGLVENILDPRNARESRLAVRIAPLGEGFADAWLYAPLDNDGVPIAPIDGSVGYTFIKTNRMWAPVYRGAAGFEISLGPDLSHALPTMAQPERYSGFDVFVRPVSGNSYPDYTRIARPAGTTRWTVLSQSRVPVGGGSNSFTSVYDAKMAKTRWEVIEANQAAQDRAIAAQRRAVEQQQQAAAARQAQVAAFEAALTSRTSTICLSDNYPLAQSIGADAEKRWFEKCGMEEWMYARARALGVSEQTFARSATANANRRAYYADLARRGANANAFSSAMAVYRTAAGAAPSDPWVPVRVTEGGRTTTQMMRQSEYDRRRP